MASRAAFTLAQTYLPNRLADIFGRTNNGHTPLAAILLCASFGFVSLAGLSNHAFNQVRVPHLLGLYVSLTLRLYSLERPCQLSTLVR